MKQLIIIIIISSSYSASAYGPDPIDSLKSLIPTLKEDTNKVNVLAKLCAYLSLEDADDAMRYGKEALELAEELNFDRGKAYALNYIGRIYRLSLANPYEAIRHYKQSLEIFIEIGDKKGESIALITIGNIYIDQGMYDKGLDFYNETLQLVEQIGDSMILSYIYWGLGIIYSEYKDQHQMAIRYFNALSKYNIAESNLF